jgi:hypothetical protein
MQIDESDEQCKKANSPINESREPDSNVIVERDVHPEKQERAICSTEEGIQMDESDEQSENADSPINDILEPDSNVIVRREVHREKQQLQRFWTEEGM